jgi:hypothetical protein
VSAADAQALLPKAIASTAALTRIRMAHLIDVAPPLTSIRGDDG